MGTQDVRKTILSLCGGLALAAAAQPIAAGNVDEKLLAMLKANGSITEAQYTELSSDLVAEQREEAHDSSALKQDISALDQKVSWAQRTVISGDIRVRQERIQVEDQKPAEQTASRQRYRARIAAVSQVTPTVEAGIRLASGNNNDVRSTNQDMNNYFTKKDIWLDRAYINWHPDSTPGLKMIGGRMSQPWTKVAESEVIWDNDINPEGVAVQYSRKFGDTNVFGSGGAFTLKDNVTGFGPEFNNDLRMYYGQLGANLFPGEDFKVTVGASVFHYYKDSRGVPTTTPNAGLGLTLNGNNSTEFQLYEGFSQVDILGLPLPLSLYGQYVREPERKRSRRRGGHCLYGRSADPLLGDRRELQLPRRGAQRGGWSVHRFGLRVGLHRIQRQQAAAVLQHREELPVPDDVLLHRVRCVEPHEARCTDQHAAGRPGGNVLTQWF